MLNKLYKNHIFIKREKGYQTYQNIMICLWLLLITKYLTCCDGEFRNTLFTWHWRKRITWKNSEELTKIQNTYASWPWTHRRSSWLHLLGGLGGAVAILFPEVVKRSPRHRVTPAHAYWPLLRGSAAVDVGLMAGIPLLRPMLEACPLPYYPCHAAASAPGEGWEEPPPRARALLLTSFLSSRARYTV